MFEEDATPVHDLREMTPNLPAKVLAKLIAYVEVKRPLGAPALSSALRKLHDLWQGETWSLELRAVALVLADLIDNGWDVTANHVAVHLQPPGLRLVGETPEQAKDRLRRALQIGRDRQLAEPNVQKFFGRMHRVVPRNLGRSSIADTIENGKELAELLAAVSSCDSVEAADRLRAVVDPIVEVCDDTARCSVTGLRLIDIWRYFRHSWSLEYRSIPGRQLPLLIRNAARPKKPVIGIAMLASPVVRMRVRDDWIGWNPEPFLVALKKGDLDSEVALRSLVARLEKSISEIRYDDLISSDELAFPAERTILRLEQRIAGAAVTRLRELSEVYTEAEEANETVRSQRDGVKHGHHAVDWRTASEEALFVRKRAETLADLLDAKRTFQSLDWSEGGPVLLDRLVRHPNGLRSINVALAELRKAGLSSQVADVCVCGAVWPYNLLLGGKLVALLMMSAEVRDAYRNKYSEQVSLISSQMAGRPIYRPAELKVLTTTSLYGNGSSQYNRLRLKANSYPELESDLEWRELATTAGYGTVHLSGRTVRVLREVAERAHKARRINNRFGEGASPRLRQVREAMDVLGIDSSSVLHHATPRIFYGCELHDRAREELLGLRPISENKGEPSAVIAGIWRQRWLAKRIKNADILSKVSEITARTFSDLFSSFAEASTDDQIKFDFEEASVLSGP